MCIRDRVEPVEGKLVIQNVSEDGTFRPQGNATRAEAAKLFSLFLSITDKLAK